MLPSFLTIDVSMIWYLLDNNVINVILPVYDAIGTQPALHHGPFNAYAKCRRREEKHTPRTRLKKSSLKAEDSWALPFLKIKISKFMFATKIQTAKIPTTS